MGGPLKAPLLTAPLCGTNYNNFQVAFLLLLGLHLYLWILSHSVPICKKQAWEDSDDDDGSDDNDPNADVDFVIDWIWILSQQ